VEVEAQHAQPGAERIVANKKKNSKQKSRLGRFSSQLMLLSLTS
jgi:hypothetical protein